MMDNVKACPFCGSEDIRIARYSDSEGGYLAVECRNTECLVSVSGATKAEAVERWNSRAGDSPALKACAFCGSPAYLHTHVDEDTGETDYTVNCTGCKAQSISDTDKQAVIARWNKRKS